MEGHSRMSFVFTKFLIGSEILQTIGITRPVDLRVRILSPTELLLTHSKHGRKCIYASRKCIFVVLWRFKKLLFKSVLNLRSSS